MIHHITNNIIIGLIAIFHWKMVWHKIMTCYYCIFEDALIDLTIFYCNYHKTMGIELCSPLIYKFRPFHHFIWISNIKKTLFRIYITSRLFFYPFSICTCWNYSIENTNSNLSTMFYFRMLRDNVPIQKLAWYVHRRWHFTYIFSLSGMIAANILPWYIWPIKKWPGL